MQVLGLSKHNLPLYLQNINLQSAFTQQRRVNTTHMRRDALVNAGLEINIY